ncbi:P-loop containing nucleoside triphosphate hydrolase protein [Aspergillus saccharolyticus JOP 1030-1]|uniref:P-loop containing nucleoside triphosphate hydrolase protein n=1 Tax=Aspergillus saccharolyticus JOP 1030-1 TaxID=1450539 RepID=A0A318ZF98_9EURO|nr:P-loop containing nucleoside triphosphate hydrolase protein [Aspergillus saccharolyticus JOP 1030-1]PYH46216.1 P-loop containing nucleoside triphosphate hydrolase protein [Aspergillus saccharolyticus JOP 1030-1]
MVRSCSLVADDSFGPVLACPASFDFTLLFEQSILSIGPSAVFLLLIPWRIWSLYPANSKTVTNKAYWQKLAVALCLVGLQTASVVEWARHKYLVKTALPAIALSLVDSISITALSAIEHDRSVRPSSLLSVYLILSTLFDAVQVRSLFIRHYPSPLPALAAATVALKLLLLALESQSKRAYLKSAFRTTPPESTSGILARTVFWWLNRLFMKGFRKLLTIEDLFPTDRDLSSTRLRGKIGSAWRKYQSSHTRSLIFATTTSLRWAVLRTVFPRLCLIGFTYAQTFFIQQAIEHLHMPNTQKTKNENYGLIGAAALIYGGIAISTVHYKHQLFRMITMFRGAAVALIYDHTMVLADGSRDDSAAVTLMSTDIDMIARSLEQVSELWARLVEIAIGIWLLERQLGAVCVAPILVILLCTSAQTYMATFMPARQKVWVGAIQRRVGIISTALKSMKSVKMLGLSEILAATLQAQRQRELDLSKDFRWLIVWLNVVASLPQMCAALVTFAAFVIRAKIDHSESLSTVQAFTSLAIISLITTPALQLLASIPAVTAALGAFDRIHKFLTSPTLDSSPASRGSGPEKDSNDIHGSVVELQMLAPKAHSDQVVLRMTDAYIRPVPESDFSLAEINTAIRAGTVTMIMGPVGSGKSTLLKAAIGELRCERGTITKAWRDAAYCSQNPWLQNTTIRNNICGYSEPEKEWYERVLRACALEQDISRMPEGDQSVVGSGALKLSGGQKQRLAIARAVYSRKEFLVLDDALSAVDMKTAHRVAEALFGQNGVCRQIGTTVMMATHSDHHLRFGDSILILDLSGRIQEQGSVESLDLASQVHPFATEPSPGTSESRPDDENKPVSTKKVETLTVDDIADISRRTGDAAVYTYYLKAIGWRSTLVACVIIIVHTFSSIFPQIWLELFTNNNGKNAAQFIGVYVVLAARHCHPVCQADYSRQIMIRVVIKSGLELHRVLVKTVVDAPMQFFASVDSGVILNRFSQDMTLVDAVLPTMAFGTVLSVAQCFAQIALISLGSSYMAVTIIPCLLVLYCAQKVYLRTSRQLRFLDLEAKSPLYTIFMETLEGLPTIRGLGWQRSFVVECLRRLDESQKPYYLLYCIQRWLNVVLDLLVAALAVILIALATSLRDSTDPGKLGVSLTAIMAFSQNLQEVVTSWTSLETSLGAIARTRSFEMKTPIEHKPRETVKPPPSWPAEGRIEITSLSASYDGITRALDNVSLNIEAGEKLVVCGRTGSGKSTLISAIMRLIDPQSGTISIDGLDISTISRNVLRSRIIAVPQDPFFLPGSIRFNLDPAGRLADATLISALERCNLLAVATSRGGLDAELTASSLSQGEQRLFGLAAALLRKWDRDHDEGIGSGKGGLLILDEATSGTDAATHGLMQQVVDSEFGGYTVLHISHRTETMGVVNRVVEMADGRIVRAEIQSH